MNQEDFELPMSQGTFDEFWSSNFVDNLDNTILDALPPAFNTSAALMDLTFAKQLMT